MHADHSKLDLCINIIYVQVRNLSIMIQYGRGLGFNSMALHICGFPYMPIYYSHRYNDILILVLLLVKWTSIILSKVTVQTGWTTTL